MPDYGRTATYLAGFLLQTGIHILKTYMLYLA
jgi:hypothetical protein